MRLVDAVVLAAVDRKGSLAHRRFGRVHLVGSFKCARDVDTEVAQYRGARLSRVVIEKNVVAAGSQALLAANEWPDLAQAGPHAAATPPGGTSRRTTANLRGWTVCTLTEKCCSPPPWTCPTICWPRRSITRWCPS